MEGLLRMDAKIESGPKVFESSDTQKIKAVKKLIFNLSFTQTELDQLVAELAILAVSPAKFSERVLTKPESNVVDIVSRQRCDLVSNIVSDVPQKTREEALKEFLQSFSGRTKVLDGYKGMSVKASRKEKTIQLRDSSKSDYFRLISYPVSHQFTDDDAELLIAAHSRFMQRREAGMSWREPGYLLHGSYRKLATFKDLFEYYKESASKKRAVAINRIQQRYFSGQWGAKNIALYSAANFKVDFLDRYVPERQRSDRNEIIKMVSAAISAAKSDIHIRIDVQQLIKKGERTRADDSDKCIPEMKTLSQFIIKSYELGFDALGLKLLVQLMASTRNSSTNKLLWQQIDLEQRFIEVECKTGYKKHPIPRQLVELLKIEKKRQLRKEQTTRGRNGEPVYVFESPVNKGKFNSVLNKNFDEVKARLLRQAQSSKAAQGELRQIRFFTQHRIRDIVEQALLDVSASEGQKEKSLGRTAGDLAKAYGNLSIEKLSELKGRMVEKVGLEFPELKALFQRLIDKEI